MDCQLNDINSVKLVIITKNQANAIDPYGSSLLMKASMLGFVETVQYLITIGADVNYQCQLGWSPLLYACFNRKYDIIKILVENGANVNTKHIDGFSPLMAIMINTMDNDATDILYYAYTQSELLKKKQENLIKNTQNIQS